MYIFFLHRLYVQGEIREPRCPQTLTLPPIDWYRRQSHMPVRRTSNRKRNFLILCFSFVFIITTSFVVMYISYSFVVWVQLSRCSRSLDLWLNCICCKAAKLYLHVSTYICIYQPIVYTTQSKWILGLTRWLWCFGCGTICNPWWRHQLETFSVLLAFCAGNSSVLG